MYNYKSFLIYKNRILITIILLISILLTNNSFKSYLKYPFEQIKPSPILKYVIPDLTSILFGFRRLGSCIAWIQLLQYYGSPEIKIDKETEFKLSWSTIKYYLGIKESHQHHHHKDGEFCELCNIEGGIYPLFLDYCLRIVYLDPYFSYVYLYGAGALAWNLDRPNEALRLLEYGINTLNNYKTDITNDYHHPFWQLHLYTSAIIYREEGNFEAMLSKLETAAEQPQAPNMIKSILANIYQKQGKYMPALRLWINIYDSNDPCYIVHAGEKIEELSKLVGINNTFKKGVVYEEKTK